MSHPLIEADTFTADVTVPDDGDNRTAASIEPAFQSLTNRTRNLTTRLAALLTGENTWTAWQRFHGGFTSRVGLGLVGAATEVFYTQDDGTPSPKEVVIAIPVESARLVSGEMNWGTASDETTSTAVTAVVLRWEIRVPSGVVVARVEADCIGQLANPQAMELRATRRRYTAGQGSTHTALGANDARTSATYETLAVVGTQTFGPIDTLVIRLALSPGQRCSNLRATVRDPGPRNF